MQLKRIIMTLLVAILMLSMAVVAASAADSETFDIAVGSDSTADVEESLNPGDIVEIKVVIQNNPGASMVEIDLVYDPAVLVPVDADKDGKVDIENGNAYTFGAPIVANKGDKKMLLVLSTAEATDVTLTGTAFTVAFQITEAFEGTASVAVTATAMKSTLAGVESNTADEPINYEISVTGCHFDYANPITEEADCLNDGRVYVVCTDEGCEEIEVIEVLKALGHNEVAVEAVPATCTEAGTTAGVKCSRCDYTTVEATEALGHNNEFVAGTAPTCDKAGLTAGLKCTVCGVFTVEQAEIAAVGHSFANYASNNDATCTEDATETGKCIRCDATDTRSVENSKAEHTVKVIDAVEATCTTTGMTAMEICEVCNTVLKAPEEVAAKGHTSKALAAVEATCTGIGLTAGEICEVCDAILTPQTVVAAKGHTEVEDAAVAATCTEAGKTAGKHCSVCNVITVAQEVVNAEGHKFGDWSVTVEATKKAAGEKERVCSVCTEKENVEIPQLPANTGMIVIIIVLAVLALGGIGATIFFAVKKK